MSSKLDNLRVEASFSENDRSMGTSFSPTRQDVERYRRLRTLSMDLNHRIVKTIPPQAYEEVGEAIGIRHNGVLVFDKEDMTSVMMDCCLYDWFEVGKNLVQRYAESHAVKRGTDESVLLGACIQAKYRILLVESAAPDAGIYCRDVLNREELFVMDVALSRSLSGGNAVLATRTMPLGEYSMTSGAGLPINSQETMDRVTKSLQTATRDMHTAPGKIALLIVRACLATGAADHIKYETAEPKSEKARRAAHWLGFKRRHN